MSWQELGSGSILNANQISDAIGNARPNSYVRLYFDLRASPAGWMLNQIQGALQSAGVPNVSVFSSSPNLTIQWLNHGAAASSKISQDPLTIAAIILGSLAVIAIVVIGWRVLNEVPESVLSNPWLWGGLAIAGILLIGAIAYRKFKGEKQ